MTSKSKILRMKERRAYRDGIKRKIGMVCVMSSKMEVVSEKLGVSGVITPPYIVASVLNQCKTPQHVTLMSYCIICDQLLLTNSLYLCTPAF